MSIDTVLYSAYSILYACVYVYICYIDDISEDDVGIPAGLVGTRLYILRPLCEVRTESGRQI